MPMQPKLVAKFALCMEKMLYQKEQLRTAHFNLIEEERFGCPIKLDENRLKDLYKNPHHSTTVDGVLYIDM